MRKKFIMVFICAIALIGLTGCGSSSNIEKELNDVIEEGLKSWKEKEYGSTFTLSSIQDSLNNKNSTLVIIASGDKEFTEKATITTYTESLENYSGSLFSQTRMLEKDMNVSYVLVYDKDSSDYYNVPISYEEFEFESGAKKEYPKFMNSNKL